MFTPAAGLKFACGYVGCGGEITALSRLSGAQGYGEIGKEFTRSRIRYAPRL
jgi:hypothetical protein